MPQEVDYDSCGYPHPRTYSTDDAQSKILAAAVQIGDLRRERDEARADLERVKADLADVTTERNELQAQCFANEDTITVLHGRLADLHSLERSFARAIDGQVQAERDRDDARAESQRRLDENRLLRSAAVSEPFHCACCAEYECDCQVTE